MGDRGGCSGPHQPPQTLSGILRDEAGLPQAPLGRWPSPWPRAGTGPGGEGLPVRRVWVEFQEQLLSPALATLPRPARGLKHGGPAPSLTSQEPWCKMKTSRAAQQGGRGACPWPSPGGGAAASILESAQTPTHSHFPLDGRGARVDLWASISPAGKWAPCSVVGVRRAPEAGPGLSRPPRWSPGRPQPPEFSILSPNLQGHPSLGELWPPSLAMETLPSFPHSQSPHHTPALTWGWQAGTPIPQPSHRSALEARRV